MALTLPKSYAQDVTQPIKMRNGGELVFTGNADVDTISVALYNNGAEYEPGGSVTLNCIRADGVTMVVSGAVSGNVASATLTQACCAVPGMMTVVMQLTSGGTGAIFAAVYNVLPSSTDTVGDAGTIIEDVAALIADIDAAVASIPQDYSALNKHVADLDAATATNTGAQYVTFTDGKGIRTNTNPVDFTMVDSASYRCAILDCAPGDVFVVSGKAASSTSGQYRLWCFTQADGTRLALAAGAIEVENLVLVAPANAEKLIINQAVYKDCFIGTPIRLALDGTNDRVTALETALTYHIMPTFELGNITFYTTGKTPTYQSSTTRVRTPKNNLCHIPAGAVLKLSGTAQVYLGRYDSSTDKWVSVGWITDTWTAPVTADYAVLARLTPEAEISDVSAFADLVYFEARINADAINERQDEMENDVALLTARNDNIRSIGHRGWMTVAPENTMPSFRLARKNGCDVVECDVQFTSDGVAVLLHNQTINSVARNADGTELTETVAIADITLAQALEYDFGIRVSEEYAGTKICTFEELVTFAKRTGLKVYAELKEETAYTEEQFETLADIVKGYGMTKAVAFISFTKNHLTPFLTLIDGPVLGYVTNNLTDTRKAAILDLQSNGADVFVSCSRTAITSDVEDFCVSNDIPLDAWTFTAVSEILNAPSLVRGFTANGLAACAVLYKAAMQ